MRTPSSTQRTKPVIIIEPGAMAKRDIDKMCRCGISVIEAKNPPAIRFLDPPPFDRDRQERAAIALCRILLTHQSKGPFYVSDISQMFCKLLMEGDALSSRAVEPVTQVPK